MSSDEALLARIREVLTDVPDVEEKKMFGSVAFMHRGNMCCGPAKGELMVRVGNDAAAENCEKPHVRICDFTGRPMKSMLLIEAAGFAEDDDLNDWIGMALAFTGSLPAK